MKLPSTPNQQSVKSLIELVLQMSFAVLIFFVFFILSVDSKPVANEATLSCGYESCPATNPAALNVHLIPHSHDDVGWLKTLDQYYFQDVQNVISSVVDSLMQNPSRRFVQVETAYFKKWWERQKDTTKAKLIKLVNNGQFEIINGAWSMNDEAAVHYQSTIDQFTLGLRYLEDNIGQCARPRVAWQIDPFGHSREQASISAHLGFDSFFFARLDHRDKDHRLNTTNMDLLWRGTANLGNTSDIFTSVLYRHYSAPPGFCFDIVCNDDPIIDDEESPDYNYETRVSDFADFVRGQAPHYPTNNLLVTMGDDFRYEAALTTYINLDRLVKGFDLFNQTYEGKPIKVFYSTPSCYAKAVNDYVVSNNYKLQMKTDDFFPYSDGLDTYWTGYFTSRPASKHFERQGNNLLQVVKQLAANTQGSYQNEQINSLKEAVGVMQHHDAITGTEKQHVAHNYHFLLTRAMNEATDAAGIILSKIITGDGENIEFDSCLLANVSACPQTQSEKFTVVVYNPLSRIISTPITLPIFTESKEWQILAPDDTSVNYELEASLRDFSYVSEATTSKTTLTFTAKNLPPLGYKVYRFEAKPSEVDEMPKSDLLSIGYEDTNFAIDEATGLLKSVTMNGITLDVAQDFEYYGSDASSGAYIFIPISENTSRIADGPVKTTVFAGNISQGVVQEFGSWAQQSIKVYNDDRSFIEFDWVIGPINIEDGGKEVITKFKTSLQNNGVFYTDSNGREILKRVRNFRPDYEYTNEQPISGNYYPVNTKIVIKDEDQGVELAVLTDRSQGGSSIRDGEIELMVHRACPFDDGRGVGENLDEQEYGQGIVVRGRHFLVLGPSVQNPKSQAAVQRDIAQRKTVAPWTFITSQDVTTSLNLMEFSGLNAPLPDNVQILTLEPWDEGRLLLRLEHLLEKDEDENLSQEVTVDLTDLFTTFTITELQETTLGGNILLEDLERLHWPGSDGAKDDSNVLSPKNRSKREITDLKITLAPMQIRTFLAKITYSKYI